MEITRYGSAAVKVKTDQISILCDPWLTDGAYYGAWCNFPPIELDKYELDNIDYIYISHVHPDHFDPDTLALLDKSIPVLIHSYHRKFLKRNIENLGFNVVELENGVAFQMTDQVKFTIHAADGCDPRVCGRLFGCISEEVKGSVQLDSLCVIDDGENVVVNTNDCPFEISKSTLLRVKEQHPSIDFALIGYTSASLFPHCMKGYSAAAMDKGKELARSKGLSSGLNILKTLNPKYFMPFAGTYVLGGKNYQKNQFLPLPELQDAAAYFEEQLSSFQLYSRSVLLNLGESFSLKTECQTREYTPICPKSRNTYIEKIARYHKYDFEEDPQPKVGDLRLLFEQAIPRLKAKQAEMGIAEDLNIAFEIAEELFYVINLKDGALREFPNVSKLENYLCFALDLRLLARALKGPRYANWNNIEIGAFLEFSRSPDVYRMEIHNLLNALHI